jgi:hypothetical protein
MRLRIDLSRECIDNGHRRDYNRCPIALALRNAGATKISVGSLCATFTYNGKKYLTDDKRIGNFITLFDKYDYKFSSSGKMIFGPKYQKKDFDPRSWVLNCREI